MRICDPDCSLRFQGLFLPQFHLQSLNCSLTYTILQNSGLIVTLWPPKQTISMTRVVHGISESSCNNNLKCNLKCIRGIVDTKYKYIF
jgi:hypothetical protein